MRCPALSGLATVATQLEGIHKGFGDVRDSFRSARYEAKQADREAAELEQRLADVRNHAALAHEKVERAIGIRDHRLAEGQALSRKYLDLLSAILKIPGDPEADEEFLHQVNVTITKALAVISGILDS